MPMSLNDRVYDFLMKMLEDVRRGKKSAERGNVHAMRFNFIELSLLENVINATLRDISSNRWEHYKEPDPFDRTKHTNFEDGTFYDYNRADAKNKWNDGQKWEYNYEKDSYESPDDKEAPNMDEMIRRRQEQAKARRKEEEEEWKKRKSSTFEEQWKAYEHVFRQAGFGAEFRDFHREFEGDPQNGEGKEKTPPKGRSKKPWWEVLGIERASSRAQIKRAYRLLASKHHPDRGGDKDMMQDINRAKAEAFEAVGS